MRSHWPFVTLSLKSALIAMTLPETWLLIVTEEVVWRLPVALMVWTRLPRCTLTVEYSGSLLFFLSQ